MQSIEKNRHNPERGMAGSSDDDDENEGSKTEKKQDSKQDKSETKQKNEPKQDSEVKQKRATFFEELDKLTKSTEKFKQSEQEKSNEQKLPTSEPEQEESLSEVEVHEAINAIIDARGDELREELEEAEDGSPEELEAVANTLFLESLRQRADSDETLTPQSIDEALAEAEDDLSVMPETELEHDNQDFEQSDDSETSEYEDTDTGTDIDTTDDEGAPGNSGSSSGSGTPPPIPPSHSGSGGFPPPPIVPPGTPPHSAFSLPPQNPNVSTGSRQNLTNHNQLPYRKRGNHDLLIGAVLGYMLGRRGGRKRTEKKLNPKIDKLEAEIRSLHGVITEKEVQIREVARKKAEQKPETVTVAVVTETAIKNRQNRVEKVKVLERKTELMSNPRVEKLGVFNLKSLEVFREKRLIDGSENSPKRKPVEIMTVQELFEKVVDVKVDGLDVLDAYKRGRITEHTLREVTKLYMRSGDYKNYFRRELQTDPEQLQQMRGSVEKLQENRRTSAHLEVDGAQVSGTGAQPQNGNTNAIGSKLSPNQRTNSQKPISKKSKKIVVSGVVALITVIVLGALLLLRSV